MITSTVFARSLGKIFILTCKTIYTVTCLQKECWRCTVIKVFRFSTLFNHLMHLNISLRRLTEILQSLRSCLAYTVLSVTWLSYLCQVKDKRCPDLLESIDCPPEGVDLLVRVPHQDICLGLTEE